MAGELELVSRLMVLVGHSAQGELLAEPYFNGEAKDKYQLRREGDS